MYQSTTKLIGIFLFSCLVLPCQGQTPKTNNTNPATTVGGPFENRDFMFIGMPKNIKATDTSPGWNQEGQKLLITGTIYKKDRKTPAPDVIVYYYHTDIFGNYANAENLDKRATKHGYIRGWVQSDAKGKYAIYTVKPASYPNSNITAHIHPSIKEPHIETPYYIDAWVFDDDPFLTQSQRKNMRNRGGNGILKTTIKGNLLVAKHDIILGLNIPNYPD